MFSQRNVHFLVNYLEHEVKARFFLKMFFCSLLPDVFLVNVLIVFFLKSAFNVISFWRLMLYSRAYSQLSQRIILFSRACNQLFQGPDDQIMLSGDGLRDACDAACRGEHYTSPEHSAIRYCSWSCGYGHISVISQNFHRLKGAL